MICLIAMLTTTKRRGFKSSSRTLATGAAIYTKKSNANADWRDPAFFTGPPGALNALVSGENIAIDDTDPANPVVNIKPFLVLTEDDAPGTPSAGKAALYAKVDGKLYRKRSDCEESEVGGGSGRGLLMPGGGA